MMRSLLLITLCLLVSRLGHAQGASPTPESAPEKKAVPQVVALPDDPACTAEDRQFMELAFESARNAVAKGGGPFGAVLVKEGKVLAEFGNCVGPTRDRTKHAETGLISAFSPKIDRETFAASTLYASSEPCTMCAGAIRFCGIGRVVYGVTEAQFLRVWGRPVEENPLTCKEIFLRTSPKTPVLGPLMEAKGLVEHEKYVANLPVTGKR